MTPPADASRSRLGELLARFPRYLDTGWRDLGEGVAYFGDASSGENGIRTNANVAWTAAVLARHAGELALAPEAGEALAGRASAVLRYLSGSHVTGAGRCAAGGRWGLEWQSAWWAAKLGLAALLLGDRLSPDVGTAVERVVVAEADRQIGRIVPTGLHGDTKAEENAWDAEILAVALAAWPRHPRAEEWRRAFVDFSANTFSAPQDRNSDAPLDGRPVCERVHTCNVHGDYSLENHGAYHFCYVASSLLSKAWCAHALRHGGQPLPAALSHHVADVWALARETFLDVRFAYVSGQDWARYTYGEYFIVPALVHLHQLLGDGRCLDILAARVGLLQREAAGNDDGSFFGTRFTRARAGGQHGKYETDCYACIALAWRLLGEAAPAADRGAATPAPVGSDAAGPPPSRAAAVDGFQHVSPEGQFCFQRTPRGFFSFSWSTLEETVPNICLVPAGADDLAEWHAGSLIGLVALPVPGETIGVRAMQARAGGIEIRGSLLVRSRRGRPLVEHELRVVFDGASATARIHSRFVARGPLRGVVVTGLAWRVPNDLFNAHVRRIRHASGSSELATTPQQRDPARSRERRSLARRIADRLLRTFGRDRSTLLALPTSWLNIDDRIGVVAAGEATLAVRRYPGRESAWGSLYVDQFEAPARRFVARCTAGTVLLDSHLIVHLGTAAETARLAAEAAAPVGGGVRPR